MINDIARKLTGGVGGYERILTEMLGPGIFWDSLLGLTYKIHKSFGFFFFNRLIHYNFRLNILCNLIRGVSKTLSGWVFNFS